MKEISSTDSNSPIQLTSLHAMGIWDFAGEVIKLYLSSGKGLKNRSYIKVGDSNEGTLSLKQQQVFTSLELLFFW